MKNFWIFTLGGILLFGSFWAYSDAVSRSSAHYAKPVLNRVNGWQAVDGAGKRIRVVQMLAVHNGSVSSWQPGGTWKNAPEKAPLFDSALSHGAGLLRIVVEDWPEMADDRAYSMHDVGVVKWPEWVEIRLSHDSVKNGSTSLVYSRKSWQEEGRYQPNGRTSGSAAKLRGTWAGEASVKPTDTRALVDTTQDEVVPDRFEFSYDATDGDRSFKDKRVVLVLQDGTRLIPREFKTSNGSVMRKAWRASVQPELVREIVLESRPVIYVKIEDLPDPGDS